MATYTRNTGAIPPAAVNKSVPALPSQDLSSIIISSFNTVKENMDDIKDVTKTGSQRIITNTNGVEDAQLVTQENEKKLVETISKQNEKHNSEKARNTQEIEKKDSEEKKKKEDKKQSAEEAKQELERKRRVERYEAMVSKTEGALAGWTRNPLAGTSQLIDKGIQKVGGKALSILNTPMGELGDSLREKASSIPFFGKYFKKNDDEKDKNEKDTKVSNVDKALKVMESSNERTVARLEKLIESFTGGEDKPSKLLPAEKNENNGNILEKYKAILETEKGSIAEKYGNSEPKKSVTEAALEDKDKDGERELRRLQMSELIKADDERKKNEKSRNKNEKDNKEIKENTMASKIAQQSIAQIVTKISAVVLGLGVLAVAVPVILDHILDWYLDFKALPGKWKADLDVMITRFQHNLKAGAMELLDRINLVNPITGQPFKIFQQSLAGEEKGEDTVLSKVQSEIENFKSEVLDLQKNHTQELENYEAQKQVAALKSNDTYQQIARMANVPESGVEFETWKSQMQSDEKFRESQLQKIAERRGKGDTEKAEKYYNRYSAALDSADEGVNAEMERINSAIEMENDRYIKELKRRNEEFTSKKTKQIAKTIRKGDYEKATGEERAGMEKYLAELESGNLVQINEETGELVLSESAQQRQSELTELKTDTTRMEANDPRLQEQWYNAILDNLKEDIISHGGRSSEMDARAAEQIAGKLGISKDEALNKITQERKNWAVEWQGTGKNPFLDYEYKGTSEKLKDITHPVVEALDKTTKAMKEMAWGVDKTVDGKDINVAVRDIQVRDGTPITN